MALNIPGVGSQYAYTEHDSAGEYLDGGRSYTMNVPPEVPAKDFWSIVLYDPQTRSELQTASRTQPQQHRNPMSRTTTVRSPQVRPGRARRERRELDPDRPRKKWFTIFRLYGPLEPWFDKTWIPGDIEPA